VAAKILTELDPEVLEQLSKALAGASAEHKLERQPLPACGRLPNGR
jgi:hypothetical protein